MLNIQNLSVSFQGEYLFERITFRLQEGDKIGLVGKNGAGKSTLLKLISKEMELDQGDIVQERPLKISFLKQDIDFEYGRTVLEEAYLAFEEIKSLEANLNDINAQLAERTDYETESYTELLNQLDEVQHRFEIIGGYNYQGTTEKILIGLGFKREDFNMPTETFSGGWRMRIELAKLLLQDNDILLLDEPTNHLDIESILWLEGFLNEFQGAIMLVSHDKLFLDNVTNRTIEISLGQIYDYNKPYSKYLVLREERRTLQLAAQKNQQKQIEHTEKLINKFRAKANKASMAQSLIKKLDRIERIEVDQEDNSVMNLRFPVSVNPGKVVFEIHDVSKRYDDNQVLTNVNLNIDRGAKIAFVGQNGQGKSTLAKVMIGEIPHQGEVQQGHNVAVGYFAQNQAEYLDGSKTVEEVMIDAANETNRSKVRDILGAFLFGGETVDKRVKVLSGGERNRLALAKLMLQSFNVLIMDEPTNHLDIRSKEVLKEALNQFEGTLILVSHDRDFLQGLTDKVYEFKDQKIKEYLGDIDFFLEQRNLQNLREAERKTAVEKQVKTNLGKLGYESQKKLKSLKNKLSKTEAHITEIEKTIKKKDLELEINYTETAANPSFFDEYQNLKNQLDTLMEDWETIQAAIENIQS